MAQDKLTFVSTAAGGYYVQLGGRDIGFVSGRGRRWYASTADFELGYHPSRREAAAAIADIDRT